METVEVVVRVPKEEYEMLTQEISVPNEYEIVRLFKKTLKAGTVLTKGHGRLIDADAILEEPFGNTYKDIDIAETIIEADKDGQDGR